MERKYVFKFGGSVYGGQRSETAIKKAILFCREYTLLDKIHLAQGVAFSQINLDKEVITTDLNKTLTEQKVPVFIFQGLHDKQTSYAEAKKYFDNLVAPEKHFYTFFYSAHLPHIQEYDLFEKIIRRDVLHLETTVH